MSPPPLTILKFEDGDTVSNVPPPHEFCLTQRPSPSELISLISMVNYTNTLFKNIETNDRLV